MTDPSSIGGGGPDEGLDLASESAIEQQGDTSGCNSGDDFCAFDLLCSPAPEPSPDLEDSFAGPASGSDGEAGFEDEASWYRPVQHLDDNLPGEGSRIGSVGSGATLEADWVQVSSHPEGSHLRPPISAEPLPLLPAIRFQGPGSADPHINAWQVEALLLDVKRRRLLRPRQPWESGPFL